VKEFHLTQRTAEPALHGIASATPNPGTHEQDEYFSTRAFPSNPLEERRLDSTSLSTPDSRSGEVRA